MKKKIIKGGKKFVKKQIKKNVVKIRKLKAKLVKAPPVEKAKIIAKINKTKKKITAVKVIAKKPSVKKIEKKIAKVKKVIKKPIVKKKAAVKVVKKVI
jgi:Zn-dependent oligopeptidase